MPTLTGSFGILASHVPTLQVLKPGVVTVYAEDGTATKYFGESSRRGREEGQKAWGVSRGKLLVTGCPGALQRVALSPGLRCGVCPGGWGSL